MLGRHIRYATQEGCLSFDNASEAFAVFLTQLQQCNGGSTFIADLLFDEDADCVVREQQQVLRYWGYRVGSQ